MSNDNAQAVHDFFNSFGLSAFDENTVPDYGDPRLPENYITYNFSVPQTFGDSVILQASLWYTHTDSWNEIDAKMEFIRNVVGMRGCVLDVENGKLRIKRGSPFAQRMNDDEPHTRRYYLVFEGEYYLNN